MRLLKSMVFGVGMAAVAALWVSTASAQSIRDAGAKIRGQFGESFSQRRSYSYEPAYQTVAPTTVVNQSTSVAKAPAKAPVQAQAQTKVQAQPQMKSNTTTSTTTQAQAPRRSTRSYSYEPQYQRRSFDDGSRAPTWSRADSKVKFRYGYYPY